MYKNFFFYCCDCCCLKDNSDQFYELFMLILLQTAADGSPYYQMSEISSQVAEALHCQVSLNIRHFDWTLLNNEGIVSSLMYVPVITKCRKLHHAECCKSHLKVLSVKIIDFLIFTISESLFIMCQLNIKLYLFCCFNVLFVRIVISHICFVLQYVYMCSFSIIWSD